ncbi:MAG: GAF and ANTAR domain-containing protein [bacterium]
MTADSRTPVVPVADIEGLAGDFAALARVLQAQDGVQHTLRATCQLAVLVVQGAEHAGITILRGRRFSTPAASDDMPELVDQIQYETRQGPCVDAIQHEDMVLAADLATDTRWPAFTARVCESTDVRSMLCYRLFVRDDVLGALNLYSSHVDAFGPESLPIGAIFAAHAAVAMKSVIEHDQVINLQQALGTSRRIGTAIGVLMSRHALVEDDAFTLLRDASQASNRKLRDVADDVVRTGDIALVPTH